MAVGLRVGNPRCSQTRGISGIRSRRFLIPNLCLSILIASWAYVSSELGAKLLAGGTACEQGYAPVPDQHFTCGLKSRRSLRGLEFRRHAAHGAAEIWLKRSRADRPESIFPHVRTITFFGRLSLIQLKMPSTLARAYYLYQPM
jgi:hypothetical protein